MSQVLAKIILDVPVSFDETALEMSEPDSQKLKKVFTELEFRMFMERIPVTVSQPEKQAAPAFEQGTLFGASLEPLVVEEKKTWIPSKKYRTIIT